MPFGYGAIVARQKSLLAEVSTLYHFRNCVSRLFSKNFTLFYPFLHKAREELALLPLSAGSFLAVKRLKILFCNYALELLAACGASKLLRVDAAVKADHLAASGALDLKELLVS